ncbi:hypothetical protein L227DRAFT_568417, partial [Lentinus tigrinus ALCF2SS1-6]
MAIRNATGIVLLNTFLGCWKKWSALHEKFYLAVELENTLLHHLTSGCNRKGWSGFVKHVWKYFQNDESSSGTHTPKSVAVREQDQDGNYLPIYDSSGRVIGLRLPTPTGPGTSSANPGRLPTVPADSPLRLMVDLSGSLEDASLRGRR